MISEHNLDDKRYIGAIKLYSELLPWGNLRNTVKDRKAMFAQSSVERVEIDTTSTTSTYGMFTAAKKINKGNFKYWDTSKITDMGLMFMNATSFNQPIGEWNTSSVVNAQALFLNATNFNQPIGKWDLSNVEKIRCMFVHADEFIKERLESFWKAKRVQLQSNDITKKDLTCKK